MNLYNLLAKRLRIYVIFVASSSAIRTNDFIGDDINFEHEILYHGDFESRPKNHCAFYLMKSMGKLKFNKLVVNGWDLWEFWVAVFTTKKKQNSIGMESTIIESAATGIKSRIKRLFVSRISTAFPSGRLHQQLLNSLGYIGTSYLTGGVGIFDRNSYTKMPREFTYSFLYVGRLCPEKNLRLLVEVFNELPRLKLTIVGSGPMAGELEEIARKNITFRAHVPNQEIGKTYLDHDVFVLPSVSEPWGLVVDEALHYGLPVLVSRNVGCHTELVEEGKTGLTFDPYDKNSLIEVLEKISEPSLFYKVKKNVGEIDFSCRDEYQIEAYMKGADKNK
ncbi:MAG: glycosyltransferase family 4 protein [Chlorobium sp.]|nr:glycosyltransferase family 4 protein [Chlorobium sp.]